MDSWIERHVKLPVTALKEVGWIGHVLYGIWILYPFVVDCVIHPEDGVGLAYLMQGLDVPSYIAPRSLVFASFVMVVILIGLSAVQCIVLAGVYKKFGRIFSTWLWATVLVGIIGNILWYAGTGFFDRLGAVVGMTPLLFMIAAQVIMERWCKKWIFGDGYLPVPGE